MVREWPGNAAPVLKGSKENMARLGHLVDALMVDGTYNVPLLPEAYFGLKAIIISKLSNRHCTGSPYVPV